MDNDIAIIVATLLGPVLAVQAQKFVERWRDDTERRNRVFKTLMATRAARLSPSHVEALNLIDLEFPSEKKRFKRLLSAWKAYRVHLHENPPEEPHAEAVFYAKRTDLFEDMLYEMSSALGYDFDKTLIGKNSYSTVWQEKMEADALTIRTRLVEVLTGKAAFPMTVVDFPNDPEFLKAQTEYLSLMTERLRSREPFPVNVVAGESGRVIPMRSSVEAKGEASSFGQASPGQVAG